MPLRCRLLSLLLFQLQLIDLEQRTRSKHLLQDFNNSLNLNMSCIKPVDIFLMLLLVLSVFSSLLLITVEHLSNDLIALHVEMQMSLTLEDLVEKVTVYQNERVLLSFLMDCGPNRE